MILKKKLLILFILATTKIFAQGEVVTYAIANSTTEAISEEAQEAINSLDNLKTDAIGDTANAVLTIIARFQNEIGNTMNKADRVLSKRENAIFNEIISLKNELDKSIENTGDRIESVSLSATQAINDFWGKKNEPSIMKVETKPYITDYTKEQRIELRGSNFDRVDTMYIKLGNQLVSFDNRTHRSMGFQLPLEIFKESVISEQKYIKGEIHSKWRQGWFKKKKKRIDPFIIPIFPKNLGTVKIKYEQNRPYKKLGKVKTYVVPNCTTGSRKLGGSRKKSSKRFNFSPTEGEHFHVPSIKFINWSQRYGGNKSFTTTTEQQIKGYITCESETKVGGGGGLSTVTIEYKQYKKLFPVRDYESKEYIVTATNPLIAKLPRPIEGHRARVNYATIDTFDGKHIILVPNGTNNFFNLQHNQDTDDVILSFKME